MKNTLDISSKDFEVVFKDNLSEFVKKKIKQFNFLAQKVLGKERDQILLKILTTLLDPELPKAGKHRLTQWERGWGENLKDLKSKKNASIIPLYFGKYNIVRFKQEFLKPESANFEYNMLTVIEYWLFDKYLRKAKSIYEFGCGTGHNLLRVREINPEAQIFGLDWAKSSQGIIKMIKKETQDTNLYAYNFDFFKPSKNFKLNESSAVYTVAALEQIGDNFQPFINYLLKNKPKICIHIEPISELLDENNLVDYLSQLYFKKRNYLNGFLLKLQELEKKGKIKIHRAQRTFIGSLYIEGYSVIVWSPLK